VRDVFCAIDWFASINGCRIQVQSAFTLGKRIQVQSTLTHSYTQLRHSLQPHRLQVVSTTTLTEIIRLVLSTFTRMDRIQDYVHTCGHNSGTVNVHTYKQFRYCLRSHLKTIHLLSTLALTNISGTTFTLTNNSGVVYVHTLGQNSDTTFTPADIIQVVSTFTLMDRIQYYVHTCRQNSGTVYVRTYNSVTVYVRTYNPRIVYVHTYGQNSGTVYVRTCKQFSYCLRSHVWTEFRYYVHTCGHNSGTAYVRTYTQFWYSLRSHARTEFRYCLCTHLQTIRVLSTFTPTDRIQAGTWYVQTSDNSRTAYRNNFYTPCFLMMHFFLSAKPSSDILTSHSFAAGLIKCVITHQDKRNSIRKQDTGPTHPGIKNASSIQ
jgi:hypothetical protein